MGRKRCRATAGVLLLMVAAPVATLATIGALTAPSAAYELPWPAGPDHREQVLQGNHVVDAFGVCRSGCTTHADESMLYAWDFDLPEGTPVLAARGGRVALVDAGWPADHCGIVPGTASVVGAPVGTLNLANEANFVQIDHGDGTSALYLHLSEVDPTILAKARAGGTVTRGELLGRSGRTGFTGCHPHLHFQVEYSVPADWYTYSLPIAFVDPDVLAQNPDGIPAEGGSYISGNVPAAGS